MPQADAFRPGGTTCRTGALEPPGVCLQPLLTLSHIPLLWGWHFLPLLGSLLITDTTMSMPTSDLAPHQDVI